ncbi:MAG: Ltp family lipoprotein [Lachnospiraceae bacterium]|nr:Ltp family lipoprotein [Lachnospiraceae bacterium]
MTKVLHGLLGIILTAALVLLVIFFYFRIAVSPVTDGTDTTQDAVAARDASLSSEPEQYGSGADAAQASANPDYESITNVGYTWPGLEGELTVPWISAGKAYHEKELEFADALRLQLELQNNMIRYNCFVSTDNNMLFVEFGFKSHDATQRMMDELTDSPEWNDTEKESWQNLKDSLLSVSSGIKKAAVDAGLANTQAAVSFVHSASLEPLLVTLNDSIFYDGFIRYSASDLTEGQRNAVARAQQLLGASPLSRMGLIHALLEERGDAYSADDCVFAADYMETRHGVDWEEQAIRMATLRLQAAPFSRSGLIRQLSAETGDRFSRWQASRAADYLEENALVDWTEQAKRAAQQYLAQDTYSRNVLEWQLTAIDRDAYTWEEATAALNALGVN